MFLFVQLAKMKTQNVYFCQIFSQEYSKIFLKSCAFSSLQIPSKPELFLLVTELVSRLKTSKNVLFLLSNTHLSCLWT